MRKMKKVILWMLGLALLMSCSAAAESARPEIPVFSGVLNTRPIETEEEAIAYAEEFWALDYVGMDMTGAVYETSDWGDDFWHITTQVGDRFVELAFDRDGNVLYVENIYSGWSDIAHVFDEEEDPELTEPEDDSDGAAAWRDLLDERLEYPFLKAVNPALYEEYTAWYPIDESWNKTLGHYNGTWVEGDAAYDLYYSESYSEDTFRIKMGVQTRPVIRIVFFDIFCDAMEGGNG